VSGRSGPRPRKRFGQHFLTDRHYVDRILAAVDPRPGQHLVEIGPGRGALTCDLLRAAGRLDAVELDRDLVPLLERACAGLGELHVYQADALRFDFCALAGEGERLRLVGNLPYNISTPLLFHLTARRHCIADCHFMLQKEVVQRITAPPGSPHYGRLGVMLAWAWESAPLFQVPPGAFTPPPRVDSAVVRLVPRARPPVAVRDEGALARVVAAAFAQRRKTLRNSLKGLLDEAAIRAAGIDPGQRPERLTLEEFARLADQAAARGT